MGRDTDGEGERETGREKDIGRDRLNTKKKECVWFIN